MRALRAGLAVCALMSGLSVTSFAEEREPELAAKLGRAADARLAHDPSTLVVKLRPEADPARVLPAGSLRIFGRWYEIPLAPGEVAAEALYAKAASPDFELVELNLSVALPAPPEASSAAVPRASLALAPRGTFSNDPLSALQWHLVQSEVPDAWLFTRGAGALVAVVDTGVTRVSDLACHTFVNEYNAITDTAGPGAALDGNGHGTHVAGTIAQCTDNGIGGAGVAPEADLMPVKVLPDVGSGDVADIARGIAWAVAHGVDVINLSLGVECDNLTWPDCSTSVVNEVLEAAAVAGAVIVAAAGNEDQQVVGFPANHPDVIAVAALDLRPYRAHYSNFGGAVDLAAPGGHTLPELPDLDGNGFPDGVLQQTPLPVAGEPCLDVEGSVFCFFQGTSMASPHVAGAAALLRSFFPEATAGQIRAALQTGAGDLGAPGQDPVYGAGRLRILNSLLLLGELASEGLAPCLANELGLCLNRSRFAVEVGWRRPDGVVGPGIGVPLTADTGYFWFFRSTNVELTVKVLDACSLNGSYWVFASGLTTVETVIAVTDTFTGAQRVYRKPQGVPFTTIADTSAFSGCF